MALRFPPVGQFLERWRSLLRRRARFDFDQEVAGLSRVEIAVAFLALLELRKQDEIAIAQASPFAPIRISRADAERSLLERPLRLIPTEVTPAAELARTIEALLVVTTQPLPASDLAAAAEVGEDDVEQALEVLAERFAEGSSGIVLEHVAGGWAFRASAEASAACERLFEKPVEKGLSQAALETLSIVAYLGPVTRPEIARIRGVNVDGVIAGLAERGLIAEGGRENEFGAIRYRTTPTVRACVRSRVAGLAAARRRPRRRRRADPRAARSGRREAPGVGGARRGTVDVVDVTDQTFETEVIERSRREPVVVDFWAEWCGPCRSLGPVLEEAATEQGITLAKVDVDANQGVAAEYGIRGIPAVKAFRNGHVVAEFVGAQPPARVQSFLAELNTPSVAESLADDPEVADALNRDDYEEAFRILLQRVETVPTTEERTEARDLMVRLFKELGQEHPLSSTWRRKLAAAVF